MRKFKTIKMDTNPIEILDCLEKVDHEPEMSEYDLEFICGIIKEYQPRKCIEVGIAGGGTSAVIINALYRYCNHSEFCVVDKSRRYYHDKKKESGFLGRQAYDLLSQNDDFSVKYSEYVGMVLPQCIKEIGDCVDFILLDTVHMLPGELLDFIVALPFLHVGSVVVLHDVALNGVSFAKKNDIATGMLFDSVVAEKYYEIDALNGFPNIAAFVITEDTKKYIMNVFGVLRQTWCYLPPHKEMNFYSEIIKMYYDKDCYHFFEKAHNQNKAVLTNITLKDKMILIGKMLLNRASSQYRVEND